MPRPRKKIEPVLKTRGGVWYADWYDPITKRTQRLSMRTRDLAEAQLRLVERQQNRLPGGANAATALKATASRRRLSIARTLCRRARENAKAKGRVYDLSPEVVAGIMAAQNFKCAVTGIPFKVTGEKRCPWAASLDQIKPGAGYTEDNVRLVLMLVNTAMNGWGPEPVLEMVRLVAWGATPRAKDRCES